MSIVLHFIKKKRFGGWILYLDDNVQNVNSLNYFAFSYLYACACPRGF
jgi:hypothetical protein